MDHIFFYNSNNCVTSLTHSPEGWQQLRGLLLWRPLCHWRMSRIEAEARAAFLCLLQKQQCGGPESCPSCPNTACRKGTSSTAGEVNSGGCSTAEPRLSPRHTQLANHAGLWLHGMGGREQKKVLSITISCYLSLSPISILVHLFFFFQSVGRVYLTVYFLFNAFTC